ncbi:hypothetical protein D922_02608 [Enterococcus faecalis 06-MB-DW-09]|nr:hypothetical protein D922_02608 [Enterococcus faecalis 06-MB-DW-09]
MTSSKKEPKEGNRLIAFSGSCGEEPLQHRSNPFSILRKIEQIRSV